MDFMNPRLPLGVWIDDFLTWFIGAFQWLLDIINFILSGLYDVAHIGGILCASITIIDKAKSISNEKGSREAGVSSSGLQSSASLPAVVM